MQTNTEFTWMLIAFVLLVGVSSGSLSGSPLVSSAGLLFAIPYGLEAALSSAFPLLAPVFILAFLYYFGMIKASLGEGMQWFIVAAFLLLALGI